ncbi:MAG: hypothetical protein ACW99Q_16875 [Candidatus Kariarchaeaceae archaeon]
MSIPRGRFNKKLTYCSEYCKSNYHLKYDILWLILGISVFGFIDLSIDGTSFTIFTWLFILFLVIDIYNIFRNYWVIRTQNLHETL